MTLIDGKAVANKLKEHIKQEVMKMKYKPGLAVVLVGGNPASQIYVSSKEKACSVVGFYSEKIILPEQATQKELLGVITKLNNNPAIHGILVQLPLSKHLNEDEVVRAIDPKKDVDCFHPKNNGELFLQKKEIDLKKILVPCTPKGSIKLIESTGISIAGKKAVIIGRSNLTGKPTAMLLLAKSATVTICHSQTKNVAQEAVQADILVAAIGKPKFVTADMVKKGAIVIDVGINRTSNGIVGDVDFENVKDIAGYITPVPGGVGPMTIACLLENTLLLAERANYI